MGRPSAGFLEWPIEDLDLTAKTHDGLKRGGVDTVGQLATMTEEELAGAHHPASGDAGEVRAALGQHGRKWGYEA